MVSEAEVPAGGGEGGEAYVTGYMPPAAQALPPLFRLGGWTAGRGDDGSPEKDSQSPGNQVEATLLGDFRVRQE